MVAFANPMPMLLFASILSLILFLVLNFSLGAPSEYCWGSDECIQNCIPSTATLTSVCCDTNCVPALPSGQCLQTYQLDGAVVTCTCVEQTQCIYAADSRYSNLSWLFLLLSIICGQAFVLKRSRDAQSSTPPVR